MPATSRSNVSKTSVLPARWGTVEELKCRCSWTPKTPLMCDAVSKNRMRVTTVVAREQGWIASRNSTRHAAKVGKGQRVAGEVKATNAVRVGGRRVASMTGAESKIETNIVGQEFGRHNESGKCPVNP